MLHREMRRLRHGLSLWEQLLATRHQELVRPLEARLKRLARIIGRVRDRDVMIQLIEGPAFPRPSGADVRRVGRLRARLRDDARTGRELLRVFLRSERDEHLFEGLRESLELSPARNPSRALRSLLDREAELRREGVRAAQKKARRRPTSTRLHRLRIQVRRLRHLDEVRARLDRQGKGAFPPAAQRFQSQLGRLHDLDVVMAGLTPDLRASAWGRALKKERRRVRNALRRKLRRRASPLAPAMSEAPPSPRVRSRRARGSASS